MSIAADGGITIVGADSRQVYRGFDVGTAKAGAHDRARVPHLGLDVADPTERYSAARWAQDAARWITAIRAEGRRPLLVGGTGFYLRALQAPLFDAPPLDPSRRAALEAFLGTLPLSELRRWCTTLDPARASLGRTQLLRAIETPLLTGDRISTLHVRAARVHRWRLRYLLVDPGARLQARIASRIEAMIAAGWMDEVRRLCATVPPEAPAWNACGYRQIRAVVEGRISLDEARGRVLVETRQYAKRQRTWFRHQLAEADVTHLDPTAPDAQERAMAWWRLEDGS